MFSTFLLKYQLILIKRCTLFFKVPGDEVVNVLHIQSQTLYAQVRTEFRFKKIVVKYTRPWRTYHMIFVNFVGFIFVVVSFHYQNRLLKTSVFRLLLRFNSCRHDCHRLFPAVTTAAQHEGQYLLMLGTVLRALYVCDWSHFSLSVTQCNWWNSRLSVQKWRIREVKLLVKIRSRIQRFCFLL